MSIKLQRLCRTLPKKSWITITKYEKKGKGLAGRGRLIDATTDRLQNYADVDMRQNVADLKSMKPSFLASLFHFSCNKDNYYLYPYWPIGPNNCSKYNADRTNNTHTYKAGQGLRRDIIYKRRPIFSELSKDRELEKYLHCKAQNANESFDGTIWELIPKMTFATLPNIEFGVYDAVANFNIGIKASVLIHEKLNFVPGVHMLRECNKYNIKGVNLAN